MMSYKHKNIFGASARAQVICFSGKNAVLSQHFVNPETKSQCRSRFEKWRARRQETEPAEEPRESELQAISIQDHSHQ